MNLLFDLDGTLADPFDAFSSSMNFACDHFKLSRFSPDTLRSLIGPPLHLELPKLLGEEKAALAPEFFKVYREHHGRDGIYQYRFYPGMDETVQALKVKHRVFIATSKPKVYADAIVEHFGKVEYFEFVYGSELSGVNSKKGDLIRHAMNERSLKASETIMIGDRKHDVIGASENGIPAIGVTWGYGSASELENAGARQVVHSWNELSQLLDD